MNAYTHLVNYYMFTFQVLCNKFIIISSNFSFLGRSGVKDDIMNFDARKVTPEARKKVADLMKKKAGSFDPKVGNVNLGFISKYIP